MKNGSAPSWCVISFWSIFEVCKIRVVGGSTAKVTFRLCYINLFTKSTETEF